MIKIAITNNSLVPQGVTSGYKVEFLDVSYMRILEIVRDRVHLGHEILTHPLAGSVKPGETPFRTVVIGERRDMLDHKSLQLIEESIATYKKLNSGKKERVYTDKVLDDFRLIDYDLIFNGETPLVQ